MKKDILHSCLLLSILFCFFSVFSCKTKEKKEENTQNSAANFVENKGESEHKGEQKNKKLLQILTWNIANFGKSKDAHEIAFMAKQIKNADIVAVQEVSTGIYGAKAIATLADELNRTGQKWDYIVSDPTSGKGAERYAFLWKTARIKAKGRAFLDDKIAEKVDREPFLGKFEFAGHSFMMLNFHAVPTGKNPEEEIVHLPEIAEFYENDCIFMMGDFNYSQKGEAFDALRESGFDSSLKNQKTSLKMKDKNGESLANEYDNIFYETNCCRLKSAEVLHFYRDFDDLEAARKISDHLPVRAFFEF